MCVTTATAKQLCRQTNALQMKKKI